MAFYWHFHNCFIVRLFLLSFSVIPNMITRSYSHYHHHLWSKITTLRLIALDDQIWQQYNAAFNFLVNSSVLDWAHTSDTNNARVPKNPSKGITRSIWIPNFLSIYLNNDYYSCDLLLYGFRKLQTPLQCRLPLSGCEDKFFCQTMTCVDDILVPLDCE